MAASVSAPAADPISLIIFDCDGVLVDSEMLSADVLSSMMAEIGIPITAEIFRSDFLGRSFASAAEQVAKRFDRSMPDDFQLQYRTRLLDHMRQHLQPMPGVHFCLAALRAPFCLATSSSPERLEVSLTVTSLKEHFAGKSFTASMVARGKPAPDLMLLAADKMGHDPRNCLVIEDSEMGVRSALNAGMQVWQFRGGAHIATTDMLPDDAKPHRLIADMAELQNALAELGLCGLIRSEDEKYGPQTRPRKRET